MVLALHSYPTPGSSGPRHGQVVREARAAISSRLAGIDQRIKRKQVGGPGFFSESQMSARHAFQDERAGLVIAFHAPRYSIQQARNPSLRAEQISRGVIVAKRATADLLSRCLHLRDSLASNVLNNGDVECKSLSRKSPAIFGREMTEKFFRFAQ